MKHLLIFLMVLLIGSAFGQLPTSPVIDMNDVDANASSTAFPSILDPDLTIDGSGMNGDAHDAHPSGHTMWLSVEGGGGNIGNNPAGIDSPAWLLFEFSVPYALEEAWIWNHNQPTLTDRGLKDISIHTSTDATTWVHLGDFTLTEAPGVDGYTHDDEIDFDMVSARYVLISAKPVDGNYGSTYYGFSEIRFYGMEEGPIPPDYPVQLESVEIDPVYENLLIPQPSGWLGSDVAHSIPLSETESIWLFADTLLGTVESGARVGDPAGGFINSSIGVHDRSSTPPGTVTFHWGPANTSQFPHEPGTPGNLYWPTEGVYVDGELFLFCYSVFSGLVLGNTVLIRVENPTDPPESWDYTVSDFGINNASFGVHSALIVEEPYLYMMGFEDTGGRRSVLARMLTSQLIAGADSSALEYWADTGSGPEWNSSASPSELVTLFRPGVTEQGIQYDETLERYFVTTYSAFTPMIYLTTAESLTGPWEEPVCIYEIPEHSVSFDIISYAVRPHPELSTQPGELIITYATNSFGTGLGPLYTPEGLGIYHPRFIRVQVTENIPAKITSALWMTFE